MRLFTAIDFSPEITELLSQKMSNFGKTVRWTPPEQLHLTLQFLGEVPESLHVNVREGLRNVKADAFELSFLGDGVFPLQGPPHVFWKGIDDATIGRAQLLTLKNAMDEALQKNRIYVDQRRYIPHVTLAHFTPQFQMKMLQFLREAYESVNGATFAVTQFHLYQSELTPKGPIHTRIESYNLNG